MSNFQQNLKKNGQFEDYKFVYSSKHNFFKMITREVDSKKSILGKVSFLKKRVSIPEEINDEKILEDEFIETVLESSNNNSKWIKFNPK